MDDKKICELVGKALELEEEGRDFYMECSKRTADENAKEMFKQLAEDEIKHYNKVVEIFNDYLKKGRCEDVIPKEERTPSQVFEDNIPGGRLNDKTDTLDALNIGIRAEENSIILYKKLEKETDRMSLKPVFIRFIEEETRHKYILEKEVEYVTETGEFHDFKTITS